MIPPTCGRVLVKCKAFGVSEANHRDAVYAAPVLSKLTYHSVSL